MTAVLTLTLATTHPSRNEPACVAARQAVTYYRQHYTTNRQAMGLPGPVPRVWYGCPRARAVVWRTRARNARLELAAYQREWAAPQEPFLSIARCEQRSETGLHGVNWRAYSQSYEGGYGFAHSTWRNYKPAGYPATAPKATIRQQTEVAKILVQRFHGYSSWPACHVRLGLPG